MLVLHSVHTLSYSLSLSISVPEDKLYNTREFQREKRRKRIIFTNNTQNILGVAENTVETRKQPIILPCRNTEHRLDGKECRIILTI